VKIGIVVQRYGAEINGGAELHARYIAERLARHVQVEVLTTCATDYITWRNALPPGVENVRGITVRRFAVSRERDPEEFGRHSALVFGERHSLRDELAWLDAEGPTSPGLVAHLREHESSFDFFIFFSFRYYHSYHGARAVSPKTILVPTAERDGALGLAMFGPIFRGVRAIMYNSFEERALINRVSQNEHVPGVVVGVGSEIPESTSASRFRQKFNLRDRFAVYVGRIDENKGCSELFSFFQRYSGIREEGMHLVLIGTPVIPIPKHPRIHHLGFVSDQDKFDAISAAELLIMPSYFESLSMVALEAWALGKPVLANGRCDVLRGQCIRSNAGLYYENFEEFLETLSAIERSPALANALGRNGREYFARHYTWPIIERKYIDMLDRLRREAPVGQLEALPGWFSRRRRNLPPADQVVAALPTGPALDAPAAQAAAVEEPPQPQPVRPSGVSRPASGVRRTHDSRVERRQQSRTRHHSSGVRRPHSHQSSPQVQPAAAGQPRSSSRVRRRRRGNASRSSDR
jgi:glycosyltransferase involved in cell wall biosynthesis